MSPRIWTALSSILCTLLPHPASGQFYTFQTKDLRLVYYSKTHEFLTPHVARCFVNSLRFHSKLFNYTPSERITVLLQDFGDYAGGGANTVPFNLVGVGIAPFDYTYETMPPLERMNMMMNHELVHIVTMDKPSPDDRFWRSAFFGKVTAVPEAPMSAVYAYLTSPRWNSPRWYIEGIAVFLETWMGGGLGRALGAYDEMVFRTMVRDSAYIYDVVGLESEGTKVDFQVGANSYLYGTRFVSYLALQYGPEKLISWFSQGDSSRGYFSSDFRRVYGVSLDEEWSKWIAWERGWQKANLDSLRRFPVTQFRPITTVPLGSVSRAYFDAEAGELYAAVNYPGQSAHIAAVNVTTGATRKLLDLRGAALFYVASLAYDPISKTLFYTTDNNTWRDICALDLRTGTSKILLKDIRTGDLAFNPSDRSLWGIRHFNAISTLVRIPFPYDEWKQVYSFEYGKDFFDIDVSPDGEWVTGALADVSGRQLLVRMSTSKLLTGDKSYEVLFDFENSIPANFVFSKDGKCLFGTSYYSGVSNVVRYDVERKEMEWVTNCESGLFRAFPASEDSVFAFHYTGQGFVPVILANGTVQNVSAIHYLGQAVVEQQPIVRSWALKPPSPSSINIDSMIVSTEGYSGLSNLRLASAYPVVEGFKNFPAYGLRFNFSDPILLNSLDLTASYTPNRVLHGNQRFHGTLNYRFLSWKVSAAINGADFYDLFGPTKTSRKGYSARVQYRDYLIFDEPEVMEYRIAGGLFAGLERLPDFQNIATSFDRFSTFDAVIDYHNLGRSLGAVGDETGFTFQGLSHIYYVNKKTFPRIWTNLGYGFLLPIYHSPIWLRGSAGYSRGKREEPFANFFFGGFGNNWVDIGEIRRYREDHSFPGVEIDHFAGTNYLKGLIEWDLPPIRFRRFGVQSLYCTWSRIALFSTGLATNVDDRTMRTMAGNIGGQIDFRLVIFSSLEATFSVGYAIAAEERQRLSRELMISLKILR